MKKLFAVLAVSSLFLTGCGGSSAKVTNLNVQEFASKIADSSVVILDVRTGGEFASGHINGATNIDFEGDNFEANIQALDKSKTYAVYCRSGNRSGQATALMAKDGFTSVFNLDGGVINWVSAGQMLVTQ